MTASLEKTIFMLTATDRTFPKAAYLLAMEALDFAIKHRASTIKEAAKTSLSVAEYHDYFIKFCKQSFGMLALATLHSANIYSNEDLGSVVFNLINAGLLKKTNDDKQEQFSRLPDLGSCLSDEFLLQELAFSIKEVLRK